MPIHTPVATFTTFAGLTAATLPSGTLWRLLGSDGSILAAGVSDGTAANPITAGLYVPFAEMADGTYGYSIDSGGTLITEDANGLLVEMTASTSWEITFTGLAPTTGAYYLLQALHLWLTISAPTAPAAGDTVYIRSETDADNYSEAAIYYDGADWEIRGSSVVAGVPTTSSTTFIALAVNGARVLGSQWYSYPATNRAYRSMAAELFTDVANGATCTAVARLLAAGTEDVSAVANTQTIRIGGAVGVGSTWDVRLHGLRATPHVVTTPGAPF